MEKFTFEQLASPDEYEKNRDSFRRQIIEIKKGRRLLVGPYISLAFENRLTVLFQIQEMLRAEHIVEKDKVKQELDVYNELIPASQQLSATLFIEITDQAKIKHILEQMIGLDRKGGVYFECGGDQIFAEFESGRSTDGKISAVHYLKFKWTADQIYAFRIALKTKMVIDHPRYHERVLISEEMKAILLSDLEEACNGCQS